MNKKTYNPPLHSQISITILCPDDVCKKRKKRGNEERTYKKLESL
jgi:hypothetical protein